MIWESFDDFIRMGGYGLYVWGAYLVTLVLLIAEPMAARARHRRALRALERARAEAEGER